MKRRNFIQAAIVVPGTMGFATNTTTPPAHFIVKAGEARSGTHTPFRGKNVNDVKVSGKDTEGQLAVFEYIGKEKIGPSYHVHHDQDEMFSIIEGEYLFRIGDHDFKAVAGDTVFAPRGVPHTWIQLTDQGKQIYAVQPAGKLEEMFVRIGQLGPTPAVADIARIHDECGLKIVGPPLELK